MLKKQSLDIVFWNCKSERIDLYRRREKIALAGLWELGEWKIVIGLLGIFSLGDGIYKRVIKK